MPGSARQIQRIKKNQGQVLKRLRLRALAEAPYAFASTLTKARTISDPEWDRMAHTWATDRDSSATFIACTGDVPGGTTREFLDSEARSEAFLGAVWVTPEYRGRGVGKGLVKAVRKWTIAQGAGVLKA